MPSAHNDTLLPLIAQISNDRHALPRHRPPADALPDDLEIVPEQLPRRPLQHRDTPAVDDALVGGPGQRVGARVQAGEVDAAVGHAGEELGAVVGLGVGGEDGVAVVAAARVGWVRAVQGGGRPARRAEDERVARQRRDGYSRLRRGEEGAVDFGGPGAGCLSGFGVKSVLVLGIRLER